MAEAKNDQPERGKALSSIQLETRINHLENQLRDLKRALRDGLLHTVRWVEKNSE